MRKGFTLLELTVAVALLAGALLIITTALKSGADVSSTLTTQAMRDEAERRMDTRLVKSMREADPVSFIVSNLGTGCMFSYTSIDPEEPWDVAGNPIYGISHVVSYDAVNDILEVESMDMTTGELVEATQTLENVEQFGIYYHKKYRALEIQFNERRSLIAVRNPHVPNHEGRVTYSKPPFLPLELHWTDLDEELPLIIDLRKREEDSGENEVKGKDKKKDDD